MQKCMNINLVLVEHCGGDALCHSYEWMDGPFWMRCRLSNRLDIELFADIIYRYHFTSEMWNLQTAKRIFLFRQFSSIVDVVVSVRLIHLVWNTWHMFRCILQIIVFNSEMARRISSFAVAFISFNAMLHRVICSHANAYFMFLHVTKNGSICHMSNLNFAHFRSLFPNDFLCIPWV